MRRRGVLKNNKVTGILLKRLRYLSLAAFLGWACGALPSPAADAAQVTQYGITWTFDKPYAVGQFVTGDYWVVGPARVVSVDPAPAPGLNGSEINPKAGPPTGWKQGYDNRGLGFDSTYDEKIRVAFPLELKPGQSLVSVASRPNFDDTTKDYISAYLRGPLRAAAILTCVDQPPPADAFRPAYVGDKKTIWTASQLHRDILPHLAIPGGAIPADIKDQATALFGKAEADRGVFNDLVTLPDVPSQERFLQRPWLDYVGSAPSGALHPMENMPFYGRDMTNCIATVGLMLLLDDPKGDNEQLLRLYVQKGIDYWGVAQSNPGTWIADGGIDSGRKWPVIFAGLMLVDQAMANVNATSAEDEQSYYGTGANGAKVLWRLRPFIQCQFEELAPEKWKDPPFKGINNGWRAEGYRSLNGPTWTGEALAARLMGAKAFWNHDAFFDYVDRWVAEATNGKVVIPPEGPSADPLTPAHLQKIERAPYKPFPSDFVRLMWETYRTKADQIGEDTAKKLSVTPQAAETKAK